MNRDGQVLDNLMHQRLPFGMRKPEAASVEVAFLELHTVRYETRYESREGGMGVMAGPDCWMHCVNSRSLMLLWLHSLSRLLSRLREG